MRVIGPEQHFLHRTRAIHDARQPAGQYIEDHADRRDQEYRGQCNLNEMRNVVAVHSLSPTRTRTVTAPASRKRSDRGNSRPAFSGPVKPMSITCRPPGSTFTVAPGGQSTDVTARICMIPLTMLVS